VDAEGRDRVTEVRVSLSSFVDFANARGVNRARMTTSLRGMYEDPARRAWMFYRDFDLALRRGIVESDVPRHLAGAIDAADQRRRPHYEALATGLLALLRSVGRVQLVPSVAGEWTHDSLTLAVRPHVSVLLRTGQVQSWYLHHKEAPLTPAAAAVPVYILRQVLEAAGSDHQPCVIDVRLGKLHRPSARTNQRHLRTVAITEAEAFARCWDLAAA
jgi:hypothetical protein